ncbi:acyl-CoA reductase-like NAD-dependent aldehyde dehydrogenase [Novosphingobium chloroacetimidivorans]|uniref:Acyl-CoA reductase-like NAD-dependent aldehyde dehydrogenase n=1 Tax=Novosphingobium chloroacetimidivorans TaxID=1428314 RepID=A0A7W7K9T9_9SPHN|nr:aldehyde dehydrogenase family protein [Novosphingobium chloroacetimidivorans]MBB4858869.1 acyl-CoA reductase-like NAD-dependent aldehyde dehydrogenase [Novosphingobium chloroacetimidivorans]
MGFQHPDISQFPEHSLVIGDSRASAGNGETFAHVYPATGKVTREFRGASAEDVDRAVAAAKAAQPAWRALPGDKRRDLMFRLAAIIEAEASAMSPLLTAENGSILIAGGHMSADAAQKFRYYGGWADKIDGRTVSTWGGPAHDYVAYEPFGTIGIIVPWNGPLFAATMVMAPALAVGNCIVLKAPELAPWSIMKLMEHVQAAGFPAGVVNLVTGGPEVGEAMVSHPGIDKIEFIGSGATARKILASAAETLKPVGLELGGKSAVLVFADANLQDAAKRGLSGAVSAHGQGCVNGTRLLVERSIYEPYIQMVTAMSAHVKIGDPFQMDTFMGPIISETSLNRIHGMVQKAASLGGRVLTGGERLGGDHAEGYYYPITVLADVEHGTELAQQEVFGPVLAITPFDSEEEAIALANGTDYGLGAYIHTTNLARAHRVANQMQAGQVQVNGSGEAMTPCVPFGGMKHSGHGRLGGIEGLREFQQVRNVWVNLNG